ncbi:C40 family peptidase [Thermomonospora cellulosilytica]|uniref:Cell wall-associated NlpC family hydrolase n=1 Tax=Thermomonospora cellulosilytica TaxID=1411118 RepID=A0A7W3RBA8_9ACTN|nr:C40 family peptidase [Thermomonospora cellulosilytica]MBA9006676.1 cell wall-associated NlpC family hydrolase [Thermomonospora cellulosilytica]
MASDRTRRFWAAACLTVATTVALPVATVHADPTPSAASVQKKLDKLNKEVEQLVEKYNQAEEDLKAARAKLKAARKAAAAELADFEKARTQIAQMAAEAYKNGDMDVARFVGTGDPQAVLDQSAIFAHLSRNRSSELATFLAAAQRVQRQQGQAQQAYDDVKRRTDELREQKQKVEKAIAQQKALLRRMGVTQDRPGSVGGTYTGPASGSARTALNYAYAQLGKPYQYGAEGPNSFDCSGLTMRAWGAAGVSIPRTTNSQYAATRRVSRSSLQPGDLVFFNSLGHVGMYVGDGKMIHAPRTGKNVEIVDITSGYYASNYYGAGRP